MKNKYLTVKELQDYMEMQKQNDNDAAIFLVAKFYKIPMDIASKIDVKAFQSLFKEIEKYMSETNDLPTLEEAILAIKDDIMDDEVLDRFDLLDLG
jgi:hypothetical protein